MKTKYILAAICLPALFAACSNDEFAVENEIGDRPTVKLKLSATYGAEGTAGTRMVNDNGTFKWEKTDVLGACLLATDVTNNNIYSNNKFVNTLTEASTNADFTTASTTVVGEYLFYYNYNPEITKDLEGVKYSLKEPQEYDPDGTKMMENNFMISPRVKVDGNEPGTLTLPLTMRSIYGYGLLNLKLADSYSAASSVNIQKIIIAYTSNVEKDGIIDVSVVPEVDLTADVLKGLREGNDEKYKGKSDEELTTILFGEADKELTASTTEYTGGTILDLTAFKSSSATNKIGQVSISCISTENPNGIALGKSGEFSTRVLLPTTVNDGTDVTISVYTDKGKFTKTQNGARIKPNHTINLANPNRTAGGEAVIEMSSFTPETEINAISEADFIAGMAQFAGVTTEKTVEVNVGDFALTPKAIAAVPAKVTLDFQTDATFSGDMTLKNVNFATDKTYTMKEGNITLGTGVANSGTIDITGAKVKAGSAGNDAKYAVKGGELTIENLDSDGKPAETTISSIVVTENGTVNVKTPITITTFTLTKGTVNNDGTISTIEVGADGKLVNKATVTTISANAGVVDNYKTITTVTSNSKTINQKDAASVITTCTTNGATGTITTVAYSQTTVTTNSGNIIFTVNARIKAAGSGNVIYNAPADIKATDFPTLSAAITKIKFSANFEYKGTTGTTLPAGIKELEFDGDLTLTNDWALNATSVISFVGATANIGGQHKISAATTLKLNVGVAAADGVDAVPTDLYIAPSTTITTAQDGLTVTIADGAKVWNDGTVNGNAATPAGWSGNNITNN